MTTVPTPPDEPTRIGIVGAGGVATRHAAALAGFADVVLAGVADTDPERAAALAQAHSVPAYDSVARLIDEAAPDAVYVCVPPFAHGDPERTVLDAGLPMFVEKPLAIDVGTAEDIAARVAAAGVVTGTGYHWRYYDTVEHAGALLAAAPARLAVGSWLDKVPPPAWWTRRAGSGGQVVEQATHVLDLMRLLVGEVVEVHATAAPADAADEVDLATAATLRFAGGAAGTLSATRTLGHKHRAGLEAYADRLALALDEESLTVDRGDGPERTAARRDAKTAADRGFVDAVRGAPDADVRAPYAEALRTHRLACAVAESARTGAPVRLDGTSR